MNLGRPFGERLRTFDEVFHGLHDGPGARVVEQHDIIREKLTETLQDLFFVENFMALS